MLVSTVVAGTGLIENSQGCWSYRCSPNNFMSQVIQVNRILRLVPIYHCYLICLNTTRLVEQTGQYWIAKYAHVATYEVDTSGSDHCCPRMTDGADLYAVAENLCFHAKRARY